MTRNDIFRQRLGRQINVRHDHDIGRVVGFDIIMQQIVARLRCKDAADKKVVCRACDSKTRRCPRLMAVLQEAI